MASKTEWMPRVGEHVTSRQFHTKATVIEPPFVGRDGIIFVQTDKATFPISDLYNIRRLVECM